MLFVLSLKGLANQKTAFWGCLYGILGMSLAIIGRRTLPKFSTFLESFDIDFN